MYRRDVFADCLLDRKAYRPVHRFSSVKVHRMTGHGGEYDVFLGGGQRTNETRNTESLTKDRREVIAILTMRARGQDPLPRTLTPPTTTAGRSWAIGGGAGILLVLASVFNGAYHQLPITHHLVRPARSIWSAICRAVPQFASDITHSALSRKSLFLRGGVSKRRRALRSSSCNMKPCTLNTCERQSCSTLAPI